MRLINTKTLALHEFFPSQVPPYAILSHTWTDDEVTLQDMSSHSSFFYKRGFDKIRLTCRLALEQGLGFAWVDTCCIDKSSSAELTESINSMFQWYKNAASCYVFLEDLQLETPVEDGLAHCRWITRGWTLQELLAPHSVQFYDMTWNHRGSKLDFIGPIAKATGISEEVLQGDQALEECSIANKMAWAAYRQTTRIEDTAYCLLGLFDVNMPLIYGEGLKAFRRLQEEIVKRNNDPTIFAWDIPQRDEQPYYQCLFATSPAAFAHSSDIVPFQDDSADFAVTNRGLRVSGDVPLRIAGVAEKGTKRLVSRYLLFLGTDFGAFPPSAGGIYLRKIGPNLFYRDGILPLAGFGRNEVAQYSRFHTTEYYILVDPSHRHLNSGYEFRQGAIYVPTNDNFMVEDIVPKTLWDATDRILLKPKPYTFTQYPTVIALAFRATLAATEIHLVVLCDYRTDKPTCKLFQRCQYERQAAMIFTRAYGKESISWADLEYQAPSLLDSIRAMEVRIGNQVIGISVSLEKTLVQCLSGTVDVLGLRFGYRLTYLHENKEFMHHASNWNW